MAIESCAVCAAVGVPLRVRFAPVRRDGAGGLRVCTRACLETLYDPAWVADAVARGLWTLTEKAGA